MSKIAFDINGIIELYESDAKFFQKNYKTFRKFINSDKRIRKLYKILYDNTVHSTKIQNQNGGYLEYIAGAASASSCSCVIGIILAYFIYKWFYSEPKPKFVCYESYPITDPSIVYDAKNILSYILPSSWLDRYANVNGDDFVFAVKNDLDPIFNVLSAFSSTSGQVATSIITVVASIGADIVTGGAGGDVAISAIMTVISAINTIIGIIDEILKLVEQDSIHLLVDIFAIDFVNGPKGVKCWINYVLNYYGKDNPAYQVICNMFNKILDRLAQFLGNLLDDMIPDSLGIGSFVIPIFMNYAKEKAFKTLDHLITNKYRRIKYQRRMILQHPERIKQNLIRKTKIMRKFAHVFRVSDEILDTIYNNAELIGLFMHKLLAFIFAMTNIFMSCSSDVS